MAMKESDFLPLFVVGFASTSEITTSKGHPNTTNALMPIQQRRLRFNQNSITITMAWEKKHQWD